MAQRVRASVLFYDKTLFHDGYIREMRVIRVPRPVLGSTHSFKYTLFYGRPGERTILYDNERMKGDHRHRYGREEAYEFSTLEQLIEDLLEDVRRARRDTAPPAHEDG